MSGQNIQFKALTIEEMRLIKDAGSGRDYIGPPVKEGGEIKPVRRIFSLHWRCFLPLILVLSSARQNKKAALLGSTTESGVRRMTFLLRFLLRSN